MTTELATTVRTLSTQLTELFAEINNTFGHAKELIMRAYNLALQEGYTPFEAKNLIIENVKFGKTTVYNALPDECKIVTRPKKIPKSESFEQEFNCDGMGVVITESESASSTGSDGNEQEIEQEYIPSTRQQDLEEENKELTKALEEQRAINKSLLAANPQQVPNLDTAMQIQNLKEYNMALQAENASLKKIQKAPEFTKASDVIPPVPKSFNFYPKTSDGVTSMIREVRKLLPAHYSAPVTGHVEFIVGNDGQVTGYKVYQFQ